MLIIEIKPSANGAHNNQLIFGPIDVPDGWAIIPADLVTPDTLKNFPFGEITVEDVDGLTTVTSWTPLPIPGPEKPPEPLDTGLEKRVELLEAETAAISAAIERGLSL